MRWLGLVLGMAMALGSWVPPAWAEASDRPRDTLVIGITQFPSTFHPNIDAMMAKTYILAMTRRPLTAYDQDWRLVCLLCTELPTIENGLAKPERSAGGRRGIAVTFKIHPKATWGDGVPVTAKDVLFTWTVGRHPKSGVGDMEFYRSLERVEVVDDKTVVLHFDKLAFDYNAVGLHLLPAHVDEANFADPETYRTRTAFDTDTTNEGLYFGPYRIAAVEPGSHVTLERNPTWHGPEPAFKRIVVRVVENTAALEANLLSGAVDMIAGEMGLPLDQTLALERRQGRRFRFIYRPGLIHEHVDLNLDNPILADIRVRRALLLALDRETINQQLFGGRQPVAHAMVSPLDANFDADVHAYAHDETEAARLLDAAGWPMTGSGVRRNAKGEPLRLEIMTTAGDRTRELVEQVLQSQWKAAGIDVAIRNQPARVFFGQTVTERAFPAMAMFAWISAPESVPRTILHSAHIPTKANNHAGQNYSGFRNAEVDQLIDRIETELDPNRRKALWHRLQDIYASELPALPLFFRAEPYVLPTWLEGVRPTGHQDPSSLWVEQWRQKS